MRVSLFQSAALGCVLAVAALASAPASAQYVIGVDTDNRDQVQAREWQAGDHVFVNRKGDNWWYPATVTGTAGPDYAIRYGTGETGRANAVHITHPRLLAGKLVEVKHPRKPGAYAKARVIDYARNRGVARVILTPSSTREFELLPQNFRVPTDALVPQRAAPAPTPAPLPTPTPTPASSTVKVCNANEEAVNFALHYYMFDYAGLSQGWWRVEPGECETVDLSKERRKRGFDPFYAGATVHIYGETDGILGGMIQKAWPRKVEMTDGRGRPVNHICIGSDPQASFFHRIGPRSPSDQTEVNSPRCVGIYQMEWMVELQPSRSGQFQYTFESE